MARPNDKQAVFSRTAFDALDVEDVDNSDEEGLTEPIEDSAVLVPSPSPSSAKAILDGPPAIHNPPIPQTKAAIKRANKTAERKAQKAKAAGASHTVDVPPHSLHLPDKAPEGSQFNPLPITDEDNAIEAMESAKTPNGEVGSDEAQNTSMISVMGSDGRTHEGNIEIRISSSQPIVSVPESSKAEKIQETVIIQSKKHSNAVVRSLTTLAMISGFIGLLLMGHIYMIILVFVCQALVFREVTSLFSLSHREPVHLDEQERRDPWSKTLNWYFFAVTNYFLYGETIIYYFKHIVYAGPLFVPFATNHRFISFTLYCIGFVGFVASLKRDYLRRQFSLFGWVHMTLLLIVVSSHFVVNNILEGMIWFWVPASLVICNDVWAYVWGVTTGRTPLLKLSPKKTVEGFVGAFFSTIVFGFFWGTFFMRFPYMTCPVSNLGVTAFDNVQCKPNPVFVWRQWEPPIVIMVPFLGRVTTIWWASYQFHVLVMACFASLVAPFGGFFASGFKRAFDIKDFGDSIPGHGGMTDRMDCQFLMGLFAYVYYSTTIRQHHVTVGSLLQSIVSGLTVEEQLQLLGDLKRYLQIKGAIAG